MVERKGEGIAGDELRPGLDWERKDGWIVRFAGMGIRITGLPEGVLL